jgi:metal-responsive CopG/Arc/MetJ family transcriptional regulator
MPSVKVVSVKLSAEEVRALDRLAQKLSSPTYGAPNRSEVIRLALRKAFAEHGVAWDKQAA